MVIQINSIEISNRKRSLNSDKVAEIAESFKLLGQLEPITVVKVNENRYRLIAGWHRLEAAKLLGWKEIEAKIFEGNELECELAEIDENLTHDGLNVLEQGEQLIRKNKILRELWLQNKSGTMQYLFAQNSNFVLSNQTKKNKSKKEYSEKQYIKIAQKIVPEVKEMIRNTQIADNVTQLLKLTRLNAEEQKKIAEKIVNGAKDIKDARRILIQEERAKIANEGKLIEPDNRWAIYQGDITTWQAPRQYDFIITDPPYSKEYLHLWKVLARRTLEWLKPGGLLIAMSGHSYLDQIYAILNEYLKYYWTAAYLTPGQPTPLNYIKKVNTTWKPLLIYSVGEYKGKIFGDVFKSDSSDKTFHDWGQSESGMYSIISGICLPGQYILDPFCGSGTTGVAALKYGCLFDGLDIDKSSVQIAKKRLYDQTKI